MDDRDIVTSRRLMSRSRVTEPQVLDEVNIRRRRWRGLSIPTVLTTLRW